MLELLGQKLDVTPHDRERIAEIVHKFGGGLAQRSKPLFLRELFQEAVIQLLDLGGRADANPLNPGAFDVAPDHFPHFTGIEGLADVVVRA